jgi:predicted MFS family arabinose efflux permease
VGIDQLTQGRAYRGWVLGLLVLISMFAFVDRQVIAALGQPIKRDLHLSDAELGLLGGLAFALLNTAISIPIARLAETRRRVTIYSIGVLLWSVATMACGLTRSFAQLLVARALVGVGEASQPAVQSLLADDYPRERRTSAMGVYVLAVPAGALIGAAGGGWIAQHADWRLAFVAAGAPGLVLTLLLILTVREPARGQYDPPGSAEGPAPPLSAVFRRMAQKPAFLHVTIGSTLASAGGFAINTFLAQYFFRRFGLDFAEAGLISGLISAIPGSISMLGAGLVADALGRRDPRAYAFTPMIGCLLAAPLYILAFLQGAWPAAAAVLAVTALFQYAYMASMMGVTQNLMAPRMRASAYAVVAIMVNVAGAGLGPLVIGALSDGFTRRAFHGDFAAACAGARAAETAAAGACGAASATGLQWASGITALVYLWGAVHFALAARTLKQDLA